MFERYDILSDITARIIFEIYHQDELSDNIADNLIKLITNDAADDKTIVFKAITYGKTISQEEKDYICRALDEEFGKDEDKEYTGVGKEKGWRNLEQQQCLRNDEGVLGQS